MTESTMSAISESPLRAAPLGLSWPLIVAAVFFPFFIRSDLLNDGDTYWHLVVGRWIIENRTIPASDLFSNSMQGTPWLAHEWLAEVLYAAAYAVAGWPAVVCLAAAAFAISLAILNRYLLRHLEPLYALCFTAAAASLALPHLLARPHVLALPILVYWGIVLVRAREEGRAPHWSLAFLMTPWANLHGSFPLGLALAMVMAGESLICAPSWEARRATGAQWAAFIGIAIAASLATPHGLSALAFAANVHRMDFSMANIGEWQSPDFHVFQPLELWLLIGAAVALTRGLRVPPVRLFLLIGLLHLSLKHVRHAELLGFLGPVLIAESFGVQWARGRGASQTQAEALDRLFASLARPATRGGWLRAIAYFVAVAALALTLDIVRPPATRFPDAAIRAARVANLPGAVLNDYAFGGYLMLAGMPPFIDGRADLYGDSFVSNYVKAVGLASPEGFYAILEKYEIGWTLFPPSAPVVALLDRLPGWKRFHADNVAVIHVRETDRQ